jgi:APA family basic amino acid/polyamine antiporter
VSQSGLVRGLGLWGASAVVVGTIIGSGVFLVANEMTRGMGMPAGVFLVWVFGGLLSLTGALAYAELATMMPEAGGEYNYLKEAYGPLWGFLYGWMQFLIGKPGSLATLGAGFARFLTLFFPALTQNLFSIGDTHIAGDRLVAFGIITVLGVVNYFGLRASGPVQTFFTVLKVGMILFLAGAAFSSGAGDWSNFRTAAPAAGTAMSGLVLALVAALWAYDGWNNVAMVAGEVENPKRNLPLALVAGTMVVGALYILANVGYFYILPAAQVAASPRVAADVAAGFLGSSGGQVVAIAAMISIIAAINGSILSGSRVPFAMAADGVFIRKLAEIHPQYASPHVSVIVLCAVAALLSLSGTYEQLFSYVIFASWIFYGLATASVIVLRRTKPNWERPYRTWGYPALPAIFVLVAGWLAVSILIENPARSLVGLGIIAAGVPAYFFWSRKPRRSM